MMMMKKRNRRTGMVCILVVLVLVVVFEMKYSSMVRRLRLRNGRTRNVQESQGPRVVQLESMVIKEGTVDSPPSQSPPARESTVIKKGARGPPPSQPPQAREIITCERSHYTYDICTIHVPTVLDPTTSTFFIKDLNPTVTKIRPHPRKWENATMSRIKELTITSGRPIPTCHVKHKSPALVFSAGGYTGNFFHEFSDGFIPLFITINSIFDHQDDDDQDVVLVISKARDWWVKKYADLLGKFSKHRIIDFDNDTSTHCFPSVTLGLISHGFLTINQGLMPNSKSLIHFHEFLNKAYGANNLSIPPRPNSQPRIILVNRRHGIGREFLNLEQIKLEIKKVGFDVIVFEPTPKTPLHKSFALINSSHAMVGIHGAALTHSLFLRPGAAFIQVVPLGVEWVAEVCFGNPAKAMGLNYMEYRVRAEESSLMEKYGKEDMMIKDPVGFLKGKPWSNRVMDIYLKEQNVRLDLVRFRKHLKEAYKKAKQLMDKEG